MYNILSKLGEGATSDVYLAHDAESKKKYALKIVKPKSPSSSDKAQQYAKNEITALRKISHKNVINLIKYEKFDVAYENKKESPAEAIVLTLEYAQHGELYKYIEESGVLTENLARFFFQQLVSGVEHIHAKGFAHRDLKLENLLLDKEFNLKIADFGFAYPLEKGLSDGRVGSVPYMAPEINTRKANNPVFGDLFACGVILFTLLAGYYPFQEASSANPVFKLIMDGDWEAFWNYHENDDEKVIKFSPELKRLLEKLLCSSPSRRYTIEEIKRTRWFNAEASSASDVKVEFNMRRELMKALKQKNHKA